MENSSKLPSSSCILSCPFLLSYVVDYSHKLGEGGFGSVYPAINKRNNEPCAIKFLQGEKDDFRSKMKEIAILKEAKNGHIIKMIDYYEDEQNNFVIFSMEIASGSLDKQRKSMKSGLKKRLLIQFIADVLTGLHFSHAMQISHSDIKPGNILLFSINRDTCEEFQTLWTFDHKLVYKLADWGSGAMQIIDKTVTMKTTLSKTKAYAAPELNYFDEILMLNLVKSDIYSFGLCILFCCGLEQKSFCALNNTFAEKKHEKDLANLMEEGKVKEKYGAKIYELIRQMVSYNSKDRIDTSVIQEKLKKIIEEEEDQCGLCEKLHSEKNRIELRCGHKLGMKCLREKILEKPLVIPRCGNSDCSEPVGLSLENLKEIFAKDEKDLGKIRTKCDGCEEENYRIFFVKLENCGHKFCKTCCETVAKKGKCLLRICKEKIHRQDKRKIEDFEEKCAVCKRSFEELEIEEEFMLKCCNSNLCVDCLKIHVYHPLLWARQEKSSIFCVICRKDFEKNYKLQKVLFESSFEYFMKKILQKKKCEKCKNYREKSALKKLACKREICGKCLNSYIEENSQKIRIKCPFKECEEIIKEKLANEYVEVENSVFNDERSQNSTSELVFTHKPQKKEEVKEERKIEKNQEELLKSGNFNGFPAKKIEKPFCEEMQKIRENCAFCEKTEIKLNCAHLFCRECLQRHLNARIDQRNFFLDCPLEGCFQEIPYYTIKSLLRKEYFEKYDYFLLKNNGLFIEEDKIIEEKEKKKRETHVLP